jgi:hypothetical protein
LFVDDMQRGNLAIAEMTFGLAQAATEDAKKS